MHSLSPLDSYVRVGAGGFRAIPARNSGVKAGVHLAGGERGESTVEIVGTHLNEAPTWSRKEH